MKENRLNLSSNIVIVGVVLSSIGLLCGVAIIGFISLGISIEKALSITGTIFVFSVFSVIIGPVLTVIIHRNVNKEDGS